MEKRPRADERVPRRAPRALACDLCGQALRAEAAGLPFCPPCLLTLGDQLEVD